MTVIVVLVNGTLSYVELSQSRPQQLAEARRINLLSFSQLTHSPSLSLLSLSLPPLQFLPFITVSRLCGTDVPPPENLPKKRLTKTEHEPFIFLCNKKRSVRGLEKVTEVAIEKRNGEFRRNFILPRSRKSFTRNVKQNSRYFFSPPDTGSRRNSY